MKNCIYISPIGVIKIIGDTRGIREIHFTESKTKITKNQPCPFEVRKCKRQLKEYFQGSRKDFNLKIILDGTAFQKRVWNELERVAFGETASYKDIAQRIDNPKGMRAVGGANNKNKHLIVVPCHRIIAADGALSGYGAGVWRKKWLLNHEKIS